MQKVGWLLNRLLYCCIEYRNAWWILCGFNGRCGSHSSSRLVNHWTILKRQLHWETHSFLFRRIDWGLWRLLGRCVQLSLKHTHTHTGDGHVLFDLLIASESKYSCRSSTCAPISSNVSQHTFWGFQSRWDLFPTARRRNETTYVWLSNSEGRFNQNSITISLLHTHRVQIPFSPCLCPPATSHRCNNIFVQIIRTTASHSVCSSVSLGK